jgi:hypothetical protein
MDRPDFGDLCGISTLWPVQKAEPTSITRQVSSVRYKHTIETATSILAVTDNRKAAHPALNTGVQITQSIDLQCCPVPAAIDGRDAVDGRPRGVGCAFAMDLAVSVVDVMALNPVYHT